MSANPTSPAPLHQVVWQLRELMAKATPGPLFLNEYGDIRAPSIAKHDKLSVCGTSMPCGSVRKSDPGYANRDLIVAAINALPALLAIAEAAHARMETYDKGEDYTGGIRSLEWNNLRTALSLLSTPSDQRAGGSQP